MKFGVDKREIRSIIKYRTKVQNTSFFKAALREKSSSGGQTYRMNKAAPEDDFVSKIGKGKRRNKNMNVIKNTQLYYIKLSPKCQVLFLEIYEIRRDEFG
ncbi:MAG: phage head closure protein [Oscillospiraceae bacterium]|nr:phage head closure protein [Oscillospiraceae bacterium]